MEKQIVFMGNSITERWKKIHPSFFKKNPFINRGVSGQTTPQMLLRFKQDVIDLKPRAVFLLAGINDIAGNSGPMTLDQIAHTIFRMVELATTHQITVFMCSVLPAYDIPWNPGTAPAQKVIDLNSMIKAYAQKHHHYFVDYYSAMVDEKNGLRKSLANDGIHPNLKGYKIMEPLVKKALLQLTK
ncbi:SGNH/GDSL hydrolase family protein [Flavobacteriaceae bacterium F08102]|nr:SGNH/GDSL hydrolase family protein [Flavobacteriaceae bacterium F08102]